MEKMCKYTKFLLHGDGLCNEIYAKGKYGEYPSLRFIPNHVWMHAKERIMV